ncbi:MFS transporter [Planobispora longispora]|uniref:MFS transporter n=1 Tax=Planobispora longispora TaxID=28887 RepID=A0A8J3W8B7_9ACTN|nr:MFS transporter [Planobispora longispora]GIH79533.1 MFS transporter [Planobispora longispora]
MTTVLEAPAGTGIYARRYRALTVGVLALVVLVAFESLAVATAMPMVGRDLDGLGLYALAFSGSMAAGMIATVLGGRWGDLRGPVAPLWAGLAAFVAGLLISGTAPGMDVFLLGRFVQGFGGGVFQVALYVLVSRVYPAGLHPKVFGALAAAWVVPSMVGPVIAGSVAVHLGWRWVFLGVPLLVAPAALLLWRGLGAAPMEERDGEGEPAGRTPIARRFGWAVLTAAGAALTQYGAQSGGTGTDGTAPGIGIAVLAAGLVLLAVSLPRLLPPGTLRGGRGLPSVIALRGIVAGAFLGGEVYLPLMLHAERGLSLTQAGAVLTGGALAWSLGSWIVGRKTYDRTLVLSVGPLVMGGGLLLMALSVLDTVPVALAFAGEALSGFGIGIVYPTLSVLVLELSAPGQEGENSASMGVGESVFTVMTVAAVGAIVAGLGATGPVYLAGFALIALLAVTGTLAARRVAL